MNPQPVVVDASRLDNLITQIEKTSETYIRIAENVDAVVVSYEASRVIHDLVQQAYVDNQAILAQLRLLARALDVSVSHHPSNARRTVLPPNVFLLGRTYGSGDRG